MPVASGASRGIFARLEWLIQDRAIMLPALLFLTLMQGKSAYVGYKQNTLEFAVSPLFRGKLKLWYLTKISKHFYKN